MTTKIGLISDVHATVAPVQEAIELFQREAVDMILCAGDIAGYGNELQQTIDLLIESDCESIIGNHEIWYLEKNTGPENEQAAVYFNSLPLTKELSVDGIKLHMVHANPPDSCSGGIRLLDQQGELIPEQYAYWSDHLAEFDYDVLIVGHTHQVYAQQMGRTLLINPGSTVFNHSCAILSLPDMNVRWFPLSDQSIQTVWNWGNHQRKINT